jgi:hypothetical protein
MNLHTPSDETRRTKTGWRAISGAPMSATA